MEHKFVELAKLRLQEHTPELLVVKQLHDKKSAKNQSGMICSGEQTLFLYTVDEKDLYHINKIIHCLEKNENGSLHLSNLGIIYSEHSSASKYSFSQEDQDHWSFSENLGYSNLLYIIGGGHCALALSSLMSSMDFYITLFDDRKDLHTIKENEFAHELVYLNNYEQLKELIPEGNKSYVVIMTLMTWH